MPARQADSIQKEQNRINWLAAFLAWGWELLANCPAKTDLMAFHFTSIPPCLHHLGQDAIVQKFYNESHTMREGCLSKERCSFNP